MIVSATSLSFSIEFAMIAKRAAKDSVYGAFSISLRGTSATALDRSEHFQAPTRCRLRITVGIPAVLPWKDRRSQSFVCKSRSVLSRKTGTMPRRAIAYFARQPAKGLVRTAFRVELPKACQTALGLGKAMQSYYMLRR